MAKAGFGLDGGWPRAADPGSTGSARATGSYAGGTSAALASAGEFLPARRAGKSKKKQHNILLPVAWFCLLPSSSRPRSLRGRSYILER